MIPATTTFRSSGVQQGWVPRRHTREVQRAALACNICGREWPNHVRSCAYVHTARRAQAGEVLARAVRQLDHEALRDALAAYEATQ